MNSPFPGFPPYRPGDLRNAAWKRSLERYNARVEENNRHFLRQVRGGVQLVLLACLFAIWELVR